MPPFDPWDVKHIEAQAPAEASVKAAQKVLRKGGFSRVEPRADGTGWWAVCQGLTDVYNVTATCGPTGTIQSGCNCPSPKRPCKHALALLLHLAAHPELRPELTTAEGPKADHLEGLIAAVFASPDDDLPRLVFADYLEERGESDRAALIRVSCELDKGKLPAARKKQLLAELNRLSESSSDAVMASFPRGTSHQIRRGFLWLKIPPSRTSEPGSMPASLWRLFQDGWVESLAFFNSWSNYALPLVRLVRRLDLTDCYMPWEPLAELAVELRHADGETRLREIVPPSDWAEEYAKLEAGESGSGDRQPVSWLQSPTASRIRALAAQERFRDVEALTVVGGDAAAITALADVADLKSLTDLHLRDTAATSSTLNAIGNSKRLRKLKFLRIEGGPLTDADVEAVGQEAAFPALTELVLRRLHLTDAGLDAIVRGPAFARLATLSVSDVPVTPAGLRRVVVECPALTRLDAAGVLPVNDLLPTLLARTDRPVAVFANDIVTEWNPADGGVLKLAGYGELPAGFFAAVTTWPANLKMDHLRVEGETFDDGAFGEVLDFVVLGRISRLTVEKCGLRNAEAVALAARLPTLAITHLDLSRNKIGMGGAKALAESPGLAKVVELDLRDNPILKSGRAALAASPHKMALTAINLGGERVEAAEAKELRKAFGKGVKVTVWT